MSRHLSQSRQGLGSTALPVKEGRSRIRSHLSVLDDNLGGQRRSKSSTSSQGYKEEAKEVQKPESNARLNAKKTTRVFRNSRNKEDSSAGRRTVPVASSSVPSTSHHHHGKLAAGALDVTYKVQAKETTQPRQVEEKKELPSDVLNVNIAEGLYEYHVDVNSYLREMEGLNTIDRNYLENDAITPHMRAVLVDWLTQVQHHLKLSEETLYRTVHTLDLVLSLRSVEPNMLQLVGVTSMLVASKLEEYYPVEIAKMLHLTENSYDRSKVLNMERTILQLVGFKVSLVINSPIQSLAYFSCLVHHAEPPGLPAEVHPGGPEVSGGRVLQELHLPPGLSPPGRSSLLSLSLSPRGCRRPGGPLSLQGRSQGRRPGLLLHLDSDTRLLHLLLGHGAPHHGQGDVGPAPAPGFRLVIATQVSVKMLFRRK